MSFRRWLLGACAAAGAICFIAACSLTALDGFSGVEVTPPVADAGSRDGDATDTVAISDATVGPDADAASDLYGATVLSDQPVAYFRFEEDATSNAAIDVVGGRAANVISGKSGFGGVGISGRGLACDGSGGGFDVGDVFDFAGLTPFSLEMWVAPTPTNGDQHLVHKRRPDNPMRGYILYVKDDESVQFEMWGATMSAWTDAPLPSTFTHLVLTVSYEGGKGNAKLWVNAQAQSAGGFDSTDLVENTDQPLRFFQLYKGLADELAIYDKALPASRILEHYRAGKPN